MAPQAGLEPALSALTVRRITDYATVVYFGESARNRTLWRHPTYYANWFGISRKDTDSNDINKTDAKDSPTLSTVGKWDKRYLDSNQG